MKTYSKKPGKEKKIDVSCAVCGSNKRKEKWNLDLFSFFKCSKCGLIYQYPQPVEHELAARYDREYFSYEIENEEKFFSLMLHTLSDIDFNSRAEQIKQKNPSFLDIGCATGMLLEYMKGSGWNVNGVEVCSASAEYGRTVRNVDIFNGTFQEAGYTDEIFSVVHSSHLIEHLTDPAGFVSEVYRVLEPGGLFITTTPNTSSLQAFVNGKNWRSAIADHMYLFSLRNLKRLISSYGFKILTWQTWGGIPEGSAPTFIKNVIDRAAKRAGIGDVMVVVAEKVPL